MNTLTVDLFRARDADNSHALALAGDPLGQWRAFTGFGSDFVREWSLELQSPAAPPPEQIDWSAVLDRAIEAAEMSDPVITDYRWPVASSR